MMKVESSKLMKKDEQLFLDESLFSGVVFDFDNGIMKSKGVYNEGVYTHEYANELIPLAGN